MRPYVKTMCVVVSELNYTFAGVNYGAKGIITAYWVRGDAGPTGAGARMTGAEGRDGFEVGDRVRIAGETDHPEEPVGTVEYFLADGGIVVVFPLAGAEVWPPSELRRVER